MRPRSRASGESSPESGAEASGCGALPVDHPTPRLMRFASALPRDPAVQGWLDARAEPLGSLARRWFDVARSCGADVRELMHDGLATACVDDAAFAYVGVFTAHMNVGFFRGVALPDPSGLLVGTGRSMRHVKVRPGVDLDEDALRLLLRAAHADMRALVDRR